MSGRECGRVGAEPTIIMKKILLVCAAIISATALSASTQWISSTTNFYYGPTGLLSFAGGQYVTINDSTGYLTAGILSTTQNVYYSSTGLISISAAAATFTTSRCTSATLSTTQNLYYNSGKLASFSGSTTATFDGANYVTSGTLSTTQNLWTSSSTIVSVPGGTVVHFSGGYYVP